LLYEIHLNICSVCIITCKFYNAVTVITWFVRHSTVYLLLVFIPFVYYYATTSPSCLGYSVNLSPLGFVVLVISGHWFSFSGHLLPLLSWFVQLFIYGSTTIIIWMDTVISTTTLILSGPWYDNGEFWTMFLSDANDVIPMISGRWSRFLDDVVDDDSISPLLSTTGSRWCVDLIVVYKSSFLLMHISIADNGHLHLLLPDMSFLLPIMDYDYPSLSPTPMMDFSRLKPLKALWARYCSRAVKWTVSEQFLHGTSAQYRLCSAILLKLYKS